MDFDQLIDSRHQPEPKTKPAASSKLPWVFTVIIAIAFLIYVAYKENKLNCSLISRGAAAGAKTDPEIRSALSREDIDDLEKTINSALADDGKKKNGTEPNQAFAEPVNQASSASAGTEPSHLASDADVRSPAPEEAV